MENETYITRYRLLLLLVRYIQIKTNKYFAVFRDPSKARYRIRGEAVGSTVVSLTYWCNERVAWQCLFCWDVVIFHPKWLMLWWSARRWFMTFTLSLIRYFLNSNTLVPIPLQLRRTSFALPRADNQEHILQKKHYWNNTHLYSHSTVLNISVT